jgi:hypothetical protein
LLVDATGLLADRMKEQAPKAKTAGTSLVISLLLPFRKERPGGRRILFPAELNHL